jgi:acyl carrier protein
MASIMTQDQILQKLTEIFHDVFMRDDIVLTPELTAKDV